MSNSSTRSNAGLPSFLCVGTQKAATSWLYKQLRQNPDVWMPPIKELHYFDHRFCPQNRGWTRWHIEQNAKRIISAHVNKKSGVDFDHIQYVASLACGNMFTEDWYRMAFDRPVGAGKLLGDITPEYCTIGEEGISYLRGFLPNPRIIWIIRDPLERALSQLRMNAERRNMSEHASREVWLNLAKSPEILARGDYSTYVPQWEQHFSFSDLLFVPFKRIASDPGGVISEVERFIGATRWTAYKAFNRRVHTTRSFAVHEDAVSYLQEKLHPQVQFLIDRFGQELCAEI
jgi:hypothetical protein